MEGGDMGCFHHSAVQGFEPREVRVAATRSAPESLGMVRDGDEVERAREPHPLPAIAGNRLPLRKAIGILDGDGHTKTLRVHALVGMHVGIPPVNVIEGLRR